MAPLSVPYSSHILSC